jgi:hypothetical protein
MVALVTDRTAIRERNHASVGGSVRSDVLDSEQCCGSAVHLAVQRSGLVGELAAGLFQLRAQLLQLHFCLRDLQKALV